MLTALVLAPELPPGTEQRASALGVTLEHRQLTGVVIRPREDFTVLPAALRDISTQTLAALRASHVPALVGPLDDQRVAVLLAQDRAGAADAALAGLARRLHKAREAREADALIIAAGSTVIGVDRAQLSLHEAMQVADGAIALAPEPYFGPPDLPLHGLAHGLREEPLVHQYVERELCQLLAYDAAHGTQLYDFVAGYCRTGGNKSTAARAMLMSRTALYDRIDKVQHILGVNLAEPEAVLALHFAVLAREVIGSSNLAVRPAASTRVGGSAPAH